MFLAAARFQKGSNLDTFYSQKMIKHVKIIKNKILF